MDFYTCSIIGFIVVEGSVVFEVDNFSVIDGILSLIASYYILHTVYVVIFECLKFRDFLKKLKFVSANIRVRRGLMIQNRVRGTGVL